MVASANGGRIGVCISHSSKQSVHSPESQLVPSPCCDAGRVLVVEVSDVATHPIAQGPAGRAAQGFPSLGRRASGDARGSASQIAPD